MANPEGKGPRAQVAKPVQVEKIKPADLTHPDWDRLDLGEAWNQPTVADEVAQADKMLTQARETLRDRRQDEKVVARAYASVDAKSRQAAVGTTESFDVGDFPDDRPLPLLGEEDDETEDTFQSLDDGPVIDLPEKRKAKDLRKQGPKTELREPPTREERAAARVFEMPASSIVEPAAVAPMPEVAPRASEVASTELEWMTVEEAAPLSQSLGLFDRVKQAASQFTKRWSRRFAVIGALLAQPAAEKPITMPQPQEHIDAVPQEAAPAPVVAEVAPVVPTPEVVPVVPQAPEVSVTVPVELPAQGVVSMPRVDTASSAPIKTTLPAAAAHIDVRAPLPQASEKPQVAPSPVTIPQPAPDTNPATRPTADAAAPKPPVVAPEVPATREELAKQMNAESHVDQLSPAKQIAYLDSLFDQTDASKLFLRLSPTKRLEVSRDSRGELFIKTAREGKIEPLTEEVVEKIGKNLAALRYTVGR